MTFGKGILWSTILILLAGTISAQESKDGKSYLCVPDRSVGYAFNDSTKTWDHANFRVGDDKYIVRPITPDDTGYFGMPLKDAYGVWKLGEDISFVQCKEGVSEHNWLRCGGEFNTKFVLNSRTNRFMLTYEGSYMIATFETVRNKDGSYKTDENGDTIVRDKEDEGGDTPVMEIGKCSAL